MIDDSSGEEPYRMITGGPSGSSTPRRIAIVGKAPSSRELAPYGNDSWEIWTLADLVVAQIAPRFDRHFELHPIHWFEQQNKLYLQWMQTVKDKPIYLRAIDERVPAGVEYPKEKVIKFFGCRYFTNTVSWMLALAIMERPEEIGIWGVDMAQSEEYAAQRPSCELFIGFALGLGIQVTIPAESDLLKCRRLYGFEADVTGMRAKWQTRTQELRERLAKKEQKMQQLVAEIHHFQGALESQGWLEQWIDDCEPNGNLLCTDRVQQSK